MGKSPFILEYLQGQDYLQQEIQNKIITLLKTMTMFQLNLEYLQDRSHLLQEVQNQKILPLKMMTTKFQFNPEYLQGRSHLLQEVGNKKPSCRLLVKIKSTFLR